MKCCMIVVLSKGTWNFRVVKERKFESSLCLCRVVYVCKGMKVALEILRKSHKHFQMVRNIISFVKNCHTFFLCLANVLWTHYNQLREFLDGIINYSIRVSQM